jgi:hypothetical protein
MQIYPLDYCIRKLLPTLMKSDRKQLKSPKIKPEYKLLKGFPPKNNTLSLCEFA